MINANRQCSIWTVRQAECGVQGSPPIFKYLFLQQVMDVHQISLYQYISCIYFYIQGNQQARLMNSEQHRLFLQSIKQSQERSARVLERIEGTLTGVRSTIADIQDTNAKFDKMKEQYNKVLDKLAQNISKSFSHPLRRSGEDDQRPKPVPISMEKAVEAMMSNDQIVFVTGAGVSVSSGIPTFRGQNGLYEKKFVFDGLELDPEAFINKIFFDSHPQPIWDWIESLQQIVKKSKPNATHFLIHDVLVQLSKKGKKVVLVTQNIDDFHIKPVNKQYEYHAIHGVANQMRCKNLHYQPYDKNKVQSKCPECSESLRPHVMFFDESYGIPFGQQVKDRQFNFAVVIGSSLNTGLCIKLVGDAAQKIEINPSPVIQVGNVHPFSQDTNKVLEEMLQCIKKY